jgi:hypothetical protein
VINFTEDEEAIGVMFKESSRVLKNPGKTFVAFYRNEAEIRNLFKRLAIPIEKLETFASCYMVRIQ